MFETSECFFLIETAYRIIDFIFLFLYMQIYVSLNITPVSTSLLWSYEDCILRISLTF